MTREEDYELASYLNEGYCEKEEEYQLISKGKEESKGLTEAPNPERGYNMPTSLRTSPEVRSRGLYPSAFVNMGINNTINSGQGSPASQNFVPTIPAQ